MPIKSKGFHIILLVVLLCAIWGLFPFLFRHIVLWQREFNQLISSYLHQVSESPVRAGTMLIALSFGYGVFHAIGPGHGKFIITSYLSTHQSQLKASMRLTLFSSLMQGIVAVCAVSIVVLVLNLSSMYFKLSQLWMERVAYVVMLCLGGTWMGQALKKLWKSNRTFVPQIRGIRRATIKQSAVQYSHFMPHQRDEHCQCGHQHMLDSQQLAQAQNVKSQLLIILSIGMRPCTGAIFILFFAYMLNLFWWGIAATMMMSFGTGITLSAFALLVQYARQSAVRLGQWYMSPQLAKRMASIVKLMAGVLLILFAFVLIYGSTIPSSGGSVLFGR